MAGRRRSKLGERWPALERRRPEGRGVSAQRAARKAAAVASASPSLAGAALQRPETGVRHRIWLMSARCARPMLMADDRGFFLCAPPPGQIVGAEPGCGGSEFHRRANGPWECTMVEKLQSTSATRAATWSSGPRRPGGLVCCGKAMKPGRTRRRLPGEARAGHHGTRGEVAGPIRWRPKHYIEWIEVTAPDGGQTFAGSEPGDKPERVLLPPAGPRPRLLQSTGSGRASSRPSTTACWSSRAVNRRAGRWEEAHDEGWRSPAV